MEHHGVPFYGYDFQNSTTVKSFTYGSMVASNTSNSERDQVGNKYYNGRPTIASKVKLAAQNLSGIMIWELGHDLIPISLFHLNFEQLI